jgi:TPR repeat protein
MDLAEAERLLDGPDPAAGAAGLLALAEAGQPRAMLQLANRLWAGRGFTADAEAAELWLRRAVEVGSARAMLSLGQRLLHGMGLDQDEAAGRGWIRRAAEGGFAPAMEAWADLSGDVSWLERAAIAEHAPAMARWGEHTGDVEWLKKAARLGSGRALGLLGERALATQPDKAFQWLEAALSRGELHFGLVLGLAHYQAGDYARAVSVFRRCLALGATGAAANLAYMARRGEWPANEPLPDIPALLGPLVERNDPAGLVNLALCDPSQAPALMQRVSEEDLGWWRELAERGDPEGLQVLSWLRARSNPA